MATALVIESMMVTGGGGGLMMGTTGCPDDVPDDHIALDITVTDSCSMVGENSKSMDSFDELICRGRSGSTESCQSSVSSGVILSSGLSLSSESNSPLSGSCCSDSHPPQTLSVVCKWTNCDWPGSYDDLVDHIREIHVELQPYHNHHNLCSSASSPDFLMMTKSSSPSLSVDEDFIDDSSCSAKKVPSPCPQQQQYVCLWEGCKVYGKGSSSRSWLERHVLQHSGPTPFKCIVEGCEARFKVRSALERHVNAHFNSSNCDSSVVGVDDSIDHLHLFDGPTMMRAKSTYATPSKQQKKKKIVKLKRGTKKTQDYFDAYIMEHLKYSVAQLNQLTGLDIVGSQRSITFHSKIIARCTEEKTGHIKSLIHWEPEDILPDVWMPESEVIHALTRTIPIGSLPSEALAKLLEVTDLRPHIKQRRK